MKRLTPDPAIIERLAPLVEASPAPSPRAFLREDFVGRPPSFNVSDVGGGFGEIADPAGVLKRVALGVQGECTGAFVYPAHSCMDWHTNSNRPGQRVYYIYSEGGGVFRYVASDGRIVDDEEGPGWIARAFTIPRQGWLWHTIYAETPRWSFGFCLTPRPR